MAVAYGPITALELSATSCNITDHTTIVCLTSPGMGANHSWHVTVASQTCNKSAVLSSYYAPSNITFSPAEFPTSGLSNFTVFGSDLGPLWSSSLWGILAADVTVTYGPYTTNCSVTVDSSRLSCRVAEGVGSGHSLSIQVADQVGAATTAARYIFPVLTSVSRSVFDSRGNEAFVLRYVGLA